MGDFSIQKTYPETGTSLTAIRKTGDHSPNDVFIVEEPTIGVGSRAKEIGKVKGAEFDQKLHGFGTTVKETEDLMDLWRDLKDKVCTMEYYIKKSSADEVHKGPFTVLVNDLSLIRTSPTRFDIEIKMTEVTVFS